MAEEFPYEWFWRSRHGERKGARCRVWARGRMNSVGVEFEDGFRTVTSRHALRRSAQASTRQRELDGARHG